MALDAGRLDDVAARVRALIDFSPPGSSLVEKAAALMRLAPLANAIPRTVRDGSVHDVVMKTPDLTKLPILTTWPLDGGPFITLPLVITKDPRTNRPNVGMYRMQAYNARETGMHWQRHKQGRAHADAWGAKVPVAVAMGAIPRSRTQLPRRFRRSSTSLHSPDCCAGSPWIWSMRKPSI